MNRRLYRCRDNRVLAGVASGVAEFFDLDPTLVRVLWFLSIFFGGVTLLVYIGLAIIVPLEPMSTSASTSASTAGAPASGEAVGEAAIEAEGHRHRARGTGRLTTFVGVVLVLFGSLALLNALLPTPLSWHYLGPIFVIGTGAVLIFVALRRESAKS